MTQKQFDPSTLTPAQKRKQLRLSNLAPFPGIPLIPSSCEIRLTAFLIEDCFEDATQIENAKFDAARIKDILLRTIQMIDANELEPSAFRVAITEGDWAKLVTAQKRQIKAGDDQYDPLNVSLRIARS